MKLGITTLVFSDMSYEEVLSRVKSLGLDGLEIYNPTFYKGIFKGTISFKPESVREAASKAESYGLEILSVNAGNNFVQTEKSLFERQVEGVMECIDAAAAIGCPVVRVFGGEPREGVTMEESIKMIIDGLKRSSSYAEEKGIILALENHGRITNNIDILKRIIEGVNSENLKINMDTGNFYWFGYRLSEVKEIIEEIIPLTAHTHMKNGKTERKEERRKPGEVKLVPLPDGDIDLSKVIGKLKSSGYKGAISIEDEFEEWRSLPLEKVMETLKRDVEYLRESL